MNANTLARDAEAVSAALEEGVRLLNGIRATEDPHRLQQTAASIARIVVATDQGALTSAADNLAYVRLASFVIGYGSAEYVQTKARESAMTCSRGPKPRRKR